MEDFERDRIPHQEQFVAILPLSRPASVSAAELISKVKERFPGLRWNMGEIPEIAAHSVEPAMRNERAVWLKIDGLVLMIVPVDSPVPPGTLEDAAVHNPAWLGARNELSKHRAHIVVGLPARPPTHGGKLKAAACLTLVSAALALSVDALGVYWLPSEMVIPVGTFVKDADRLLTGRPPVETWVRLSFARAPTALGKTGTACVTMGLFLFVGREIELRPTLLEPPQIAARLLSLIAYLIKNGQILKDGESVGRGAAEVIRVRLMERGEWSEVPIVQLEVESIDSSFADLTHNQV